MNPTNLCVYSCKFCDYAAKKGDAHAYELTEPQIFRDLEDPSVVEAHIVGGLWPSWRFGRSLDLVRAAGGLAFDQGIYYQELPTSRGWSGHPREILADVDAGEWYPGGNLSDRIRAPQRQDWPGGLAAHP